MEWQTETSPFVLRVRGKQWYWVYKLDLTNSTSIDEIPCIIGRGKKVRMMNVSYGSHNNSKLLKEARLWGLDKQDAVLAKADSIHHRYRYQLRNTTARPYTEAQLLYKKPTGTTTPRGSVPNKQTRVEMTRKTYHKLTEAANRTNNTYQADQLRLAYRAQEPGRKLTLRLLEGGLASYNEKLRVREFMTSIGKFKKLVSDFENKKNVATVLESLAPQKPKTDATATIGDTLPSPSLKKELLI